MLDFLLVVVFLSEYCEASTVLVLVMDLVAEHAWHVEQCGRSWFQFSVCHEEQVRERRAEVGAINWRGSQENNKQSVRRHGGWREGKQGRTDLLAPGNPSLVCIDHGTLGKTPSSRTSSTHHEAQPASTKEKKGVCKKSQTYSRCHAAEHR